VADALNSSATPSFRLIARAELEVNVGTAHHATSAHLARHEGIGRSGPER
jgi:hypothetical protein